MHPDTEFTLQVRISSRGDYNNVICLDTVFDIRAPLKVLRDLDLTRHIAKALAEHMDKTENATYTP